MTITDQVIDYVKKLPPGPIQVEISYSESFDETQKTIYANEIERYMKRASRAGDPIESVTVREVDGPNLGLPAFFD